MAELRLHGERQIQDATITKEKLILVDPVFLNDPVTLGYLNDLGIEDGLSEVNQRIDQGLSLIDELSAKTYPDLQPNWINSNSIVSSTTGAGATVSNTNKSIAILSGSTGAGASLRQYIDLSAFPDYKVGDKLILRLLLVESVVGAINANNVEITMRVDGVAFPITYTTTVFGGNETILEIRIPYTITSITSIIDITFAVKSSALVQPTNLLLTWNFFGLFNTKDRHHDTVEAVSQTLKNAIEMYTFFERATVISKVNITNSVDNTSRLQDEFDLATQTSGEIVFPRNATILVQGTVEINGGLRLKGRGSTNFNPDNTTSNKEMFRIVTPDSIILEDLAIFRLNGFSNSTSIKFDPSIINTNSIFRNVRFANLINALYVDYCDNLTLDGCIFDAGQSGVNIGHIDQASVKNITIRRSMFNVVNVNNIYAKSANNLTVSNNFFRNVSPSATYASTPLLLEIAAGNHSNVKVVENSFEAFRNYAIRASTVNTGTLKKILISNNIFKDKSSASGSSATAGVMFFNSITTPYSMENVIVENNDIETKYTAFDFRGVDYLNINNNTIKRDSAGAFATAKVYNLVDVPNQVKLGNLIQPGLTLQ